MAERKPQGMPWETWVERRLREAREKGAFEDLPGLGQPLEVRDHDALSWVRDKARQEGLPVTALLPPSLAVAKEVEDLPATLARESSERRVRELLGDLNGRIDAARRGPQVGPPVRTGLLDVEQRVAAWRAALTPVVEPAPEAKAPATRSWRRPRRGRTP